MKTRLRLNPGQKGAKRLTALYGERLVCVRYRYDEAYPLNALVRVRVAPDDLDLRRKVKEAGGRWNPKERVWYVAYGAIAGSKVEKHIAVDAGGA